MGMALAKLNRHKEASRMLQNAIAADPHNPLARFELANVLVDAHCFNEALQELELLKVLAIPSQQNTNGIDLCLKSCKIVYHIKRCHTYLIIPFSNQYSTKYSQMHLAW